MRVTQYNIEKVLSVLSSNLDKGNVDSSSLHHGGPSAILWVVWPDLAYLSYVFRRQLISGSDESKTVKGQTLNPMLFEQLVDMKGNVSGMKYIYHQEECESSVVEDHCRIRCFDSFIFDSL